MNMEHPQEWAFFNGPTGKRRHNRLCRRCAHSCKQSYRAVVVHCPRFERKRLMVVAPRPCNP